MCKIVTILLCLEKMFHAPDSYREAQRTQREKECRLNDGHREQGTRNKEPLILSHKQHKFIIFFAS